MSCFAILFVLEGFGITIELRIDIAIADARRPPASRAEPSLGHQA